MINKIITLIIDLLFNNNFIVNIRSNKFVITNYNYDFAYLNFENQSTLKNILFSNRIYEKKKMEDRHVWCRFLVLIPVKRLG